jgi:hypothetical protein
MDHRDLFHQGTLEFKNNFRIRYYLNNVNKEIQVDTTTIKIFDDIPIMNENNPNKKTQLLAGYLDYPVLSTKLFNENYCKCNKYFDDLNQYMLEYKKSTNNSNNQCVEGICVA